MFVESSGPPLAYRDPWDASFDARLKMLSRRHRKIAYYYELPDTSTFRYRIFNPVEALAHASGLDVSASWFHHADADRMAAFMERADALVICRTRYNATVARVISRARARNLPVLFDVDDLVFDPGYTHLIVDTLDHDVEVDATWDGFFAFTSRYSATLRMCDAAITTNERLASHLRRYMPGMPVSIVPNFLNRAQQEASRAMLARKRLSGFERDNRVHVGYFSGTPTHNRDFAVAAGAIVRLLERRSDVVVRVVGFLEPKGSLRRHSDRIEMFPLQDFLNLQRLIAEVEINLAPLQDNIFTNCKSELKYFEAAACGTITVASPTFTFSRAISDSCNGFLANAQEWDDKLEAALAVVEDRSTYATMAERAFRHVERDYGWDRHARAIVSAVFEFGDPAASKRQVRCDHAVQGR